MIENYHRYVHLRMKHVVRNKYIVQKWMFFQTLIVLLFDFEISNWNRQKKTTQKRIAMNGLAYLIVGSGPWSVPIVQSLNCV